MNDITLASARKIVAAAFVLAEERAVARATVVVTDIAGAIVVLERNDASGPYGSDFAVAKARTALGMRSATLDLASAFLDRPGVIAALGAAVSDRFLPLGGGVLVLDDRDTIVGAAAFSGAPHEIDHAIAAAAVEAAGLRILE